MIERRSIIKGLVALVAAPAIIKVADLMPVNAKLQPDSTFVNSGVSLREIAEYVPAPWSARLAVLYGSKAVRPEWALDGLSERVLEPIVNRLAEGIARDVMEREAIFARDFYIGERWSDGQIGEIVRVRMPNDWMLQAQSRQQDLQIPAPLALAAAAVAVAPALLERPVTRRFWAK